MPDRVEVLLELAKALPVEDQWRLVDLLLASLGEAPMPEVQAAWDEEIERRLAEYDRGEVQAVDAEEVFAKARQLLRR